jgi:glutathione S-transferase
MRKLLFSNGSPYARRVRIVLLEKGLAFESDVLDVVRPIEEIRPHNPALQVPVFYDGERHLFGSNLILQYLWALYPTPRGDNDAPPLAPAMTRADRHWDDLLILTTIEAMTDAYVNLRFLVDQNETTVPFIGRQNERIRSCLDWLEQRITDEGFWPGTFSSMDLNLLCTLHYSDKRQPALPYRSGRWPKIVAMTERWRDRPSIAVTPVNDWPPKA